MHYEKNFVYPLLKIYCKVIGRRHYDLAQKIRPTLAQYAELKDIIAMLGMEQLSSEDQKVIGGTRRLERILTQPLREKFRLPSPKRSL